MRNYVKVHVTLHNKIRTPIIDMTSLLKYEAMCDMRNEEKVHVALHDKVRTRLLFVVNGTRHV